MKRVLKNRLFIFLLGVILSGSIVYAAVYRAQDISYDNTKSNLVNDNNQNITNVQDAIDSLYSIANNNDTCIIGEGTLLYETTSSTHPTDAIQLSDSVNNYSMLKLDFILNTQRYTDDQIISMIIPVSIIPVGTGMTAGDTMGPENYRGSAGHGRRFWVSSSDSTILQSTRTTQNTDSHDWVVKKVYGIN